LARSTLPFASSVRMVAGLLDIRNSSCSSVLRRSSTSLWISARSAFAAFRLRTDSNPYTPAPKNAAKVRTTRERPSGIVQGNGSNASPNGAESGHAGDLPACQVSSHHQHREQIQELEGNILYKVPVRERDCGDRRRCPQRDRPPSGRKPMIDKNRLHSLRFHCMAPGECCSRQADITQFRPIVAKEQQPPNRPAERYSRKIQPKE